MTTFLPLSDPPILAPIAAFGGLFTALAAGAGGAWLMHRRTRLSAWNLYLLAGVLFAVVGAAAALVGPVAVVLVPALVAAVAAAVVGRRLRGSALGAGGELRAYERERL